MPGLDTIQNNIVNNIDEIRERDDIYAGGTNTASYIQTSEFEPSETPSTDSVDMGSPRPGGAAETPDTSSAAPTDGSDNPGYIPNDGTLDRTSSDTSDNSDIGLAADVDSELDDVFDGFSSNGSQYDPETGTLRSDHPGLIWSHGEVWADDTHYMADETGLWMIDGKAVEDLHRRLMALCNIRLAIMRTYQQKNEIMDSIYQSASDLDFSDIKKRSSLSEAMAKSNQKMNKLINQGFVAMFKAVQTHNNEIYQARCNPYISGDRMLSNFINSSTDEEPKAQARFAAARDYETATRANIESMRTIFRSNLGDPTIDRARQLTMTQLLDPNLYTQRDSNGFIDTAKTNEFIVNLRKVFTGQTSIFRAITSTELQKTSIVKTVYAAANGKDALTNRFEGVEEAVESESAYETAAFDRLAGDVLQAQRLQNVKHQQEIKIQKLEDSLWTRVVSNICNALSAIVGVFSIICPALIIVTAALQVIRAIVDYIGSDTMNDERDLANPSASWDMNLHVDAPTGRRETSENQALNGVDNLEDRQRELVREAGSSDMINNSLSSSYDSNSPIGVQNERFAALSLKLNGIQNAERIVAKALKHSSSTRRAILSGQIGIRNADTNDLMISGMDDIMKLNEIRMNSLIAAVRDYIEAHNERIERQLANERALASFGIGLLTAIISAALGAVGGGGAGAFLGWGIGQALGSSATDYYYSSNDPNLNVRSNPSISEIRSADRSDMAALEESIYNTYSELIKNGTVDAGNGNRGVNTDQLIMAQKRLEKIFTAMSNILAVTESKSKTLKSVWQALGITTTEAISVQDVYRAYFAAQMQVLRAVSQMLNEQVMMANRANAAQRNLEMSTIKGATSLVTSVATVGAAGAGTMSLANFFQSCNGLLQMGIAIYYGYTAAFSGTGDLVGLMVNKNSNEKNPQSKTPLWRTLERLERVEANLAIEQGNIENIGGGNIGLNSGEFEVANQRLEQINMVNEAINDAIIQARETMAAIYRSMRVAAPNSPDALAFSNNIARTFSAEILQAQMQAVQQFTSRSNEINAAQRDFLIKSISAALQAVSFVISCSQLKNQMTKERLTKMQEKGAQLSNADKAKLQEALEALYGSRRLGSPISVLSMVMLVVRSLNDTLVGYAWDKLQSPEVKDHSKNTKNTNRARAGQTSQSVSEAESSDTASNFGEAVDGMYEESVQSSLRAGQSELEVQFNDILLQHSKEIIQGIEELIKMVRDKIHEIKDSRQQDPIARVPEQPQSNQAAASNALAPIHSTTPAAAAPVIAPHEEAPAAAAAAAQIATANAAPVDRPVVPQPEAQAKASNAALFARADQIEQSIQSKTVQQSQVPSEATTAQPLRRATANQSNGRPLTELNLTQLRGQYIQARTNDLPAAQNRLRDASLSERAIREDMQRCDRTTQEGREEYSRLETQLQAAVAEKGQARTEIRGIQQRIGEISRVYRTKAGTAMEPITDADIHPATAQASRVRPSQGPAVHAPAEHAAEAPATTTTVATAAASTASPVNQREREEEQDSRDLLKVIISMVDSATGDLQRLGGSLRTHSDRLQNLTAGRNSERVFS